MANETFKSINDKYIRRVETFRREDLRFTKAAYSEIAEYDLSVGDVLECLNCGRDSGRRRKRGIVERCLRGLKVVVAESWDMHEKRPVWAVIHVGKVGK